MLDTEMPEHKSGNSCARIYFNVFITIGMINVLAIFPHDWVDVQKVDRCVQIFISSNIKFHACRNTSTRQINIPGAVQLEVIPCL